MKDTNLKLRVPLPPGRSFEQVKRHYLVEKEIAERLKRANRTERRAIYSTMYDELFREVPDHPRLMRRQDEAETRERSRKRLAALEMFLNESTSYVEFGPGDCTLAMEVAKRVKSARAVDISDQRLGENTPENFQLVVYDGYDLKGVDDDSVDVVFSDQLIEHFHPEDTKHHFELVHRILKPGGQYYFRTPHAQSGPHDVSRYFYDTPVCFHLKEWTYSELKPLLKELGYSRFYGYWFAKGMRIKIPFFYFQTCEKVLGVSPKRLRRFGSEHLIRGLVCVAVK